VLLGNILKSTTHDSDILYVFKAYCRQDTGNLLNDNNYLRWSGYPCTFRVLARSKKKSAFTWIWEIYFSLKPGISLWVWGHAVTPSRFLKFLCLWNGISRILGVILSKCSYKHVFNYFLADPNWEIATSR
jgi:hypothetical protein